MAPAHVPKPSAAKKPQRNFDPAIHDYVSRAFNTEDYEDISQGVVAARLNRIINEIIETGQEFTTNWATLPLPQEMIIQERKAAAAAQANAWMYPPQPTTFPPPHLPPPPPHLPPPPTNMMPAAQANSYHPSARYAQPEESHTKARKRRFQEMEPVRQSPTPPGSPSHRYRSITPPGKRQRVRSSTRSSRYSAPYGRKEKQLPTQSRMNNEYMEEDDARNRYVCTCGVQGRRYPCRMPTHLRYQDFRDRDTSDRYYRPHSPVHRSRRDPPPTCPRYSKNGLQDRVTRNTKGSKKKEENRKYQQDLERRKQRFAKDAKASKVKPDSLPNDKAVSNGRLVGTNMELEKDYYRLTSDPKPELVRPQKVLEKTLVLLKEKWERDRKYNYMKSQLKSMRQDLTVQHIKNSFTIQVYETHARIALEMSDLGEYNQCQTQLRALYKRVRQRLPTEFVAYRILYFTLTKNTAGHCDILMEMNDDERNNAAVKNALGIRSALALGNYHRFFHLAKDVPNLGHSLVGSFIARERLAALANYAKATKYPVPTTIFITDFGFEWIDEGLQFLVSSLGEGVDINSMLEKKENGQEVVHLWKMASVLRQAANVAAKTIDIKGQI